MYAADPVPGYAFCPTRLNPSDGLSRCREWQWDPGPSPPWLHGLATGDPHAFSLWSTVPKQGFRLAEWVRITLKLWWSQFAVLPKPSRDVSTFGLTQGPTASGVAVVSA